MGNSKIQQDINKKLHNTQSMTRAIYKKMVDNSNTAQDVNIVSPDPINVFVTNQIDITTMESTLASILTSVQAIDTNTDQVETLLNNIITTLGTLDSDDDGTALASIISELGNVIIELQDIDANTVNLETVLNNILAEVTPNSTEATQLQVLDALDCDDLVGQLLSANSDVAPNFQLSTNTAFSVGINGSTGYSVAITSPTIHASVSDLVDYLNSIQADFVFTYVSDTEILFVSNSHDVTQVTSISWANDDGQTTSTLVTQSKVQACLQIETRDSVKSLYNKLDSGIEVSATLTGTTRTPSLIRATDATGSPIAAGSKSVSVYNAGAANGVVLGGVIKPGESITWSANGEDTLSAVSFDGTGTELVITTVS